MKKDNDDIASMNEGLNFSSMLRRHSNAAARPIDAPMSKINIKALQSIELGALNQAAPKENYDINKDKRGTPKF